MLYKHTYMKEETVCVWNKYAVELNSAQFRSVLIIPDVLLKTKLLSHMQSLNCSFFLIQT